MIYKLFFVFSVNIIFKKSFLDFHKIISNNKFDIIHNQGFQLIFSLILQTEINIF